MKKRINIPVKYIVIIIALLLILLYIAYRYSRIEHFNSNNDKIAFCFLTMGAVNKYNIWDKFFENVDKSKYNIYMNPKNSENVNESWRKYILPNTIKDTAWGSIKLVEATLNMFKQACELDKDNKYFILVTDSCIPVHNFDYIYDKIINGKSTLYKLVDENDDYHLKHRYDALSDDGKKAIEYKNFKKSLQFVVLMRDDIEKILKPENNRIDWFKNVNCSDEHYFPNMSEYLKLPYKNEKVTFVNWKDKSPNLNYSPFPKTYETLTDDDINNIRNDGYLFMRKVVPETQVNINTLLS